jgi:hypothetical protein
MCATTAAQKSAPNVWVGATGGTQCEPHLVNLQVITLEPTRALPHVRNIVAAVHRSAYVLDDAIKAVLPTTLVWWATPLPCPLSL